MMDDVVFSPTSKQSVLQLSEADQEERIRAALEEEKRKESQWKALITNLYPKKQKNVVEDGGATTTVTSTASLSTTPKIRYFSALKKKKTIAFSDPSKLPKSLQFLLVRPKAPKRPSKLCVVTKEQAHYLHPLTRQPFHSAKEYVIIKEKYLKGEVIKVEEEPEHESEPIPEPEPDPESEPDAEQDVDADQDGETENESKRQDGPQADDAVTSGARSTRSSAKRTGKRSRRADEAEVSTEADDKESGDAITTSSRSKRARSSTSMTLRNRR